MKAGDAREQIKVRNVEAIGVRNPVRDRDDHVAHRIHDRFSDQPLAQRVLVAPAGLRDATLVLAKRVGKKPGLRAHPRSTAIELVAAECHADQLFEPVHLL